MSGGAEAGEGKTEECGNRGALGFRRGNQRVLDSLGRHAVIPAEADQRGEHTVGDAGDPGNCRPPG
jgi:hypothetical protein